MKKGPGLFNQWKNKADTSDTLNLSNAANQQTAQFDVDISEPLASIDLFFKGVMTTGGGAADPQFTPDATLKMFTIAAWIERENGNIDLIPAGTELYRYYRLMERLFNQMYRQGLPGGFAIQSEEVANPFSYVGVTGVAANTPEGVGIHVPIPFGFLGGSNFEYQAGVFVPRPEYRSLKIEIKNKVNASGVVSVTKDYPFPTSSRNYAFVGVPGTGNFEVQCVITKMDASRLTPGLAGKVLPLYREKSIDGTKLTAGLGTQNGIVLDKWDRGMLWQAIGLFDSLRTTATGLTYDRGFVNGPATGMIDASTILREMVMYANTTRLNEFDIFNQALIQNSRSGGVGLATNSPHRPIVINLCKLCAFEGLNDLRRYFTENDNVILEFNNVPQITANVRDVTAAVWGYQVVSNEGVSR